MRVLINEDKKLCFWTSQKAGSTILFIWFLKTIGQYDKALKVGLRRYRNQSGKWASWSQRKKEFLRNPDQDKYYKVALVRNPYARAVSIFLHCLERHPQNISDRKLNPRLLAENPRVIVRVDYSKFGLTPNLSFHDFLLLLIENQKTKKGWFEGHTLPQLRRRIDISYFSQIIKLESIEAELDQLNQRFELGVQYKDCDVPHHTERRTEEETFETEHYNLGYRSLYDLYDGVFPDFHHFYTPEIIDLLAEIHGIDLESLDYPSPLAR